jgi:hypothetical protein
MAASAVSDTKGNEDYSLAGIEPPDARGHRDGRARQYRNSGALEDLGIGEDTWAMIAARGRCISYACRAAS